MKGNYIGDTDDVQERSQVYGIIDLHRYQDNLT